MMLITEKDIRPALKLALMVCLFFHLYLHVTNMHLTMLYLDRVDEYNHTCFESAWFDIDEQSEWIKYGKHVERCHFSLLAMALLAAFFAFYGIAANNAPFLHLFICLNAMTMGLGLLLVGYGMACLTNGFFLTRYFATNILVGLLATASGFYAEACAILLVLV